jgi:hypothetical protein
MARVVINACFGGFSLSPEATIELWKRGGPVDAHPVDEYFKNDRDPDGLLGRNKQLAAWREYLQSSPRSSLTWVTVFSPDESLVLYARDIPRDNPLLVQLVEEMGEAANGSCASLRIVEVPDDAEWEIAEYDGHERVAEKHRVWS